MPGLPFSRLPAGGPMAQQAEQEFKSAMKTIDGEYEIEARALGQQFLTEQQHQNKLQQLRGKYSLRASREKQDWNQRMTQIREYEKLGAAGTISPEQSSQAQYGLSGYNVPKQQKPDYWAEHRNLIQERERIQQINDQWDFHRGKWKQVESVYTTGKKKDQVKKRGREATPQEVQQIEAVQGLIGELDQYEFALLQQMDPQHRKVNQLSRAMAMGPRVQGTPGVGGRRENILSGGGEASGKGALADKFISAAKKLSRVPTSYETPGYKMTREKAITQAQQQLGSQASKERVLALAKQIYGGNK